MIASRDEEKHHQVQVTQGPLHKTTEQRSGNVISSFYHRREASKHMNSGYIIIHEKQKMQQCCKGKRCYKKLHDKSSSLHETDESRMIVTCNNTNHVHME